MNNTLKLFFTFFLFWGISSSLWAKNNTNIAPWWQEQMKGIEQELSIMENAYKMGDKESALKAAQTAHFTYYKNSDLETAIRRNYSMRMGEVINLDFLELSRILLDKKVHISSIRQQVAEIKENILKTLPNLPLTDKLKEKRIDIISQQERIKSLSKDYTLDLQALNQELEKVLTEYRNHNSESSLNLLQNAYFTYWQSSGLEKSLEVNYRQKIIHNFSHLVNSIKKQSPSESLVKQVSSLQQSLQQINKHKLKSQRFFGISWIAYCITLLVLILFIIGICRLWVKAALLIKSMLRA